MKVTSETGPMIDSTRETLAKWVETKQLISKEKSEWVAGKDVLGERVRLAEAETASVKDKLKEIELAVAEAQKKRDELSAENEKLKATGFPSLFFPATFDPFFFNSKNSSTPTRYPLASRWHTPRVTAP